MNFKCEELTLSDDRDFACTVLFSDTCGFNPADWPQDENVRDLMIQRYIPKISVKQIFMRLKPPNRTRNYY